MILTWMVVVSFKLVAVISTAGQVPRGVLGSLGGQLRHEGLLNVGVNLGTPPFRALC